MVNKVLEEFWNEWEKYVVEDELVALANCSDELLPTDSVGWIYPSSTNSPFLPQDNDGEYISRSVFESMKEYSYELFSGIADNLIRVVKDRRCSGSVKSGLKTLENVCVSDFLKKFEEKFEFLSCGEPILPIVTFDISSVYLGGVYETGYLSPEGWNLLVSDLLYRVKMLINDTSLSLYDEGFSDTLL